MVLKPPPGIVNRIRFSPGASLASSIAWRSEPGPALSVLVTTKSRYGITRILNVHELEFPEPSIAVQVIVFVPIGKTEPLVGELNTWGAPSQLSDTAGTGNVTAAPPESCGASATIM